jgi:hypothetical protein
MDSSYKVSESDIKTVMNADDSLPEGSFWMRHRDLSPFMPT